GGQRQIVGRVVKQRVTGYLDLMIVNVGMRSGQADGLRVGDKVNLMSALRQFHAQFGGDHSTAAVGGITGNSNFHRSARLGPDYCDWMAPKPLRFRLFRE